MKKITTYAALVFLIFIASCGSSPDTNTPPQDTTPQDDEQSDTTQPDTAKPEEKIPSALEKLVDKTTQYEPANGCSFDKRTDINTTQLWIGNPSWQFRANQTDVYFYMPDKMFALFLGYVQEVYDINPNFLLSIAGKETMAIFLEGTEWLYPIIMEESPNNDGPFQFERTTALAEMMQNFSSRVNSIDETYHYNYVNNFNVSTIPISLYLTWEKAYLENCTKFNFNNFVSLAKDPDVLFQSLAYGYNRGIFGDVLKDMLVTNRSVCIESTDVVQGCSLNGSFDYNVEIKNICNNLATADNVYEVMVERVDLESFVEKLQTTYVQTDIDWQNIKDTTLAAFDILKDSESKISARYHWIPILRQILPLLPVAEFPTGSFQDYMNSSTCK